MPVQLTWLLDQDNLALRLVCGSADGIEVEWAHAIELQDPSPWLAGGELRAHHRAPAATHARRAGGIRGTAAGGGHRRPGLRRRVRFTAIPAGVRQRCEELDLPLLEVPLPTPFIAVSQRIAQRLADDQQQALQRAVAFQQALTRRALREGPAGLVALLARQLGRPVVLLDEHGRPFRCRRGPTRWHGVWQRHGRPAVSAPRPPGCSGGRPTPAPPTCTPSRAATPTAAGSWWRPTRRSPPTTG